MHKLLFDNNISHRILPRIAKLFVDSTHVMIEGLDEASDLEVWEYAKTNNYTIVTKDSDFNDLVIFKRIPPKVIWLKIGNCKVIEIEQILKEYEQTIKVFLNEKESAILEI